MVFVVTQITNWEECRGSHSIAAQYQAKVLSATELQGVVTSEAVAVDDREIAEKVVAKFHYERDIKRSKISLASALELVRQEDKPKKSSYLEKIEKIEKSDKERALLEIEIAKGVLPVLIQRNFDNYKADDFCNLLTKEQIGEEAIRYSRALIAASKLPELIGESHE